MHSAELERMSIQEVGLRVKDTFVRALMKKRREERVTEARSQGQGTTQERRMRRYTSVSFVWVEDLRELKHLRWMEMSQR